MMENNTEEQKKQQHLADLMVRAKKVLDVTRDEKNEEFNTIVKSMDTYIRRNCRHHYVEDLIDIDPDRSQSITYCSRCMLTFSRK